MHDPNGGIVVLAVDNADGKAQVERVSSERGYRFTVALDPRAAVHRQYGITLRPTTAVIGPDGTLLALRVGVQSPDAWRAELRRLGALPNG